MEFLYLFACWLGTEILTPSSFQFAHHGNIIRNGQRKWYFFSVYVCVRVSSCWLFVGWKNKNCQSFSGWHTKRLKKLIFTFYRVSTKNRPLENARALYWIRGKIFSTKKKQLNLENKKTSGSKHTNTIMQLKLRAQPYIICVVSFIFGCCLFCFHDKFIVYYRYGAQFVVSFLFFSLHFICFDGVRFCCQCFCWHCARARVSTQVSLRKMLAN